MRPLKKPVIGTILLALMFFNACAKELSQQDREREQAILDFERLSAAKGTYSGFLHFDDGRIPCTLDVLVQYNPSGNQNKPLLQGTLRIGFFAGTQVVSRESSFNFSNSELKFVFPSASAGVKTEVRGTLLKTGELSVQIETPSGQRAQGHLTTANVPVFNLAPNQHWKLEISEADTLPLPAVLQLTQTFQQIAAPVGSDLPEMVELEGGLLFSHFARTPIRTTSVYYAPFGRHLDVRFSNGTRLFFSGLALSETETALPETLPGTLITRDSREYEVTASPSLAGSQMATLPPDRFQGSFQADPTAPVFPTIAYLEYRGATGTNPETFPFAVFPSLRLVVLVCSKENLRPTLIKKSVLELASLDYLTRGAVFRTQASTGTGENFNATYLDDWSRLQGNFEASGSGIGTARPFIKLQPDSSIGYEGCDELLF